MVKGKPGVLLSWFRVCWKNSARKALRIAAFVPSFVIPGITWQSAHSWCTGRTQVPRAEFLALLAHKHYLELLYILLGADEDCVESNRPECVVSAG